MTRKGLDILFDPRGQLGIFLLPAQYPGGWISARFDVVAPAVKPSRLDQTIVTDLSMQIVQSIALGNASCRGDRE
jgi:hypothetical protein